MTPARSWRDEAAAALVVKHLDRLLPRGPVLVLSDPLDDVASALELRGLDVGRWWRRAAGGRPASAWPPSGPWATVALRLPRAKDELEMTAHAAADALAPGGRLLVYGATDEGIKSAPGRVGSAFGSVTSVATGGRCRIVEARDPGTPLRDTLEAWALSFDPGVEGVAERWRSYPGVFAHGRVDGGTRLLLEHLPPVEPGQRVVDFGCGHGIVGARVLAREPAAEVTFVDVDAVALEAVRSNLGPVAVELSDGWGAVAPEPVDHVVSNPPYHAGKGESFAVIRELVEGAARRLPARGTLTLVVQRRLPVETLLSPSFARVEAVADDGPWRVWRAAGARGRTRGA